MAVLADLLVRFGADSAELRRTLKTVEGDLKKFTRDVGGMKRALEGAFAVVGIHQATTALGRFIMSGVDAADQMGKLAQKTGVSVEALSGLTYAAKLSDVSSEDLGGALAKLAKVMGEASAGGKAQAAVFRALGISVTDSEGNLRNAGDVLVDIADRFAEAEDGAAKATIAQELFGRSGAQLIPFLNQGSRGIAGAADELARFGGVVTADAAEGADQFSDDLDRLKVIGEALALNVANELVPALDDLLRGFEDTAGQGSVVKEMAEDLAAVLKTLAGMGLAAARPFEMLGKRIGAIGAAAVAMINGDFAGVSAINDQFLKEMDEIDRRYAQHMDALGFGEDGGYRAGGARGKLQGTLTRTGGPPLPAEKKKLRLPLGDDAEKDRAKRLAEEMKRFNDLVSEAEKIFDDTRTPMEAFNATMDRLDELLAQGAIDFDVHARAAKQARDTYFEASGGAERLADEMRAIQERSSGVQQVMDSVATPAEKYADEIKRLNDLFEGGQFMPETYTRAVQAAGRELVESNTVLSTIADASTSAFSAMARAAMDGANVLEAVWNSVLNSFLGMLETMLSEWIKTQMAMAVLSGGLGGLGGGGALAGGGAFSGVELLSAGPGVTPGNTLPLDGAGVARATEVHLNIQALDAASFDDYLAKNEGVLAGRISRLTYKGRI